MKRVLYTVITIGAVALLLVNCAGKDRPVVPMNKVAVSQDNYEGEVAWISQHTQADSPVQVVGIHGTPGGWGAWSKLMAQAGMERFPFYALDRPGWGQSQNETAAMYPQLVDQANIIAGGLRKITSEHKKTIVISHSWGGPVALALTTLHPELVDGLVLIASPASPEVSEPRWYHKAATNRPIQLLIGERLTDANQEMLTLDSELLWLQPQLGRIHQPTVVMQGEKDWLVKPENAFYLQRELTGAEVNLMYDEKGDHFIPFEKTHDVLLAIEWVDEQLINSF